MADHSLMGGRGLIGQRGSIHIEMLFFVPPILIIWSAMHFSWEAKHEGAVIQRKARECGWAHAMSGCSGGGGCAISSGGRIGDGLYRTATVGTHEMATFFAPWIAPNTEKVHGRSFSAETVSRVARPAWLGGSASAYGKLKTACADDPPIAWDLWRFFPLFCRFYIGAWCPL